MDTHEIIQIANTYATNNGIYHYSKILGRGGFGVVLKAQDQIQVRMVAIKIILAEKSWIQFLLGGTPAAAEAGQKEANMLTNLKHVNVIAIRDHFKFEVTRKWAAGFAIVMDYCSKGNLQSHLEQLICCGIHSLNSTKKEQWCQQLATALAFIHQQEVVHRDLKPENILIDEAENLKIADVGIAKAICDKQGTSIEKYMQTVIGSYWYMAPEVWGKHYTRSSDVFSLGLVMFVICELPDPLKPIVYFPSHMDHCALGKLMYSVIFAPNMPVTLLLNTNRCTSDEKMLLNDMLQYEYRNRPTASGVIKKLKIMEERRREEERRRKEEEEQKMREKRRQAEQLNWWKCNVICFLIMLFGRLMIAIFVY